MDDDILYLMALLLQRGEAYVPTANGTRWQSARTLVARGIAVLEPTAVPAVHTLRLRISCDAVVKSFTCEEVETHANH